jgi:hypothetical protein
MGDYLQVVGRSDVDRPLISLFRQSFLAALRGNGPWRVKTPWLLSLALPFDRLKTVRDIYEYLPFLNGDHTSFWFLLPDTRFSLPTVYVTDTRSPPTLVVLNFTVLFLVNYRGLMQYCRGAYCDSLNLLTEDNLRFLAVAVDSMIRSASRLAQSQCASSLAGAINQLSVPGVKLA